MAAELLFGNQKVGESFEIATVVAAVWQCDSSGFWAWVQSGKGNPSQRPYGDAIRESGVRHHQRHRDGVRPGSSVWPFGQQEGHKEGMSWYKSLRKRSNTRFLIFACKERRHGSVFCYCAGFEQVEQVYVACLSHNANRQRLPDKALG